MALSTPSVAERGALRRRPAPVFYGGVIVAGAFVTMGLGVNARTAFSLLLPPILDEFGWPRRLTAGAMTSPAVTRLHSGSPSA